MSHQLPARAACRPPILALAGPGLPRRLASACRSRLDGESVGAMYRDTFLASAKEDAR